MSRVALLLILAACVPETRPAEEYCELTVDSFCGYYLRCGRIAESTPEDCENTFLETCNGVYEPHYEALEEEGLLELSTDGMKACEDHLETVSCEEQVSDLQGPCGAMWVGLAGEGAACGLGIESFVCDDDTTCVIGLDLCGTCEAALDLGEACGEGLRCRAPNECVEGECVEPALPGQSCATIPCILGTSCVDQVCVAPEIVAVGDTCDAEHRCPYKSACIGGQCLESALQGEGCGPDRICASGYCNDGTCAPLRGWREACDENIQCQSGVCGDDGCEALPGACFEESEAALRDAPGR